MSSNGSNFAQPDSTFPPAPPGEISPQNRTPGCGSDLNPVYSFLCDTQAAWGIVVETLAVLGFLVAVGVLVGLLAWMIWQCVHYRKGVGGAPATLALFILGPAGLFGLTFAFIIQLTPQTCPTRVFLFGVLMAFCFSALLSRALALQGVVVTQGWGEAALTLALTIVQVIIGAEWLLIVLVRDQQPCHYNQGWTSPSGEMHTLGRENRSFEGDSQDRKGKRKNEVQRSPYESGFSMTDINPSKDFSIPRPQTTNTSVLYDDYYGQRLSH
ncbi:G-protein coupled receptor family C group 5 member B isoform X2 [Scleropages formosus]|uniref:G-protein coupled receptor family C group 5 member B isoform X2 n=1 Tax=Scleropages formosus TaxID=113540 RepID=UPI0010FAB681|nr:G-protein coupled receptor family C group 5 member B-like isoform X2 [Scleropages formosus]